MSERKYLYFTMASVEQHRVASTASVVSPSARGIGIDTRRDPSPAMKAFYVVASIFLPPVAVAVRTGDPCETIISCGWLLCGWIPAIVHSVMVSFGDTRCSCGHGFYQRGTWRRWWQDFRAYLAVLYR